MSINLNSRNNTLCCKVNDLYTALMASELLNDCVDDVVVMLKTCVDYVNIVSSQEVQIQHARFTMDGEEFRQYHLCLPVSHGGGPSRVRQPKCTTATPKRCNVRTRPSLTAFNQRRSACCSGMYSPLCLPAPYTNRGLSFAYSKTVTRSRPCI